jgi:hypothetical protein
MATMKIILVTAVLLTGGISADAQNAFSHFGMGDGDVVTQQVLTGLGPDHFSVTPKYARVTEGSPYFRDEWSEGSLLLENGKVAEHIQLRLDLFGKEIHYKNADSQEMILTTPTRAVMLMGAEGRIFFVPGTPWREIDKALDGAWLQVLVNDTVSLLHEIRKSMIDRTPFGGSTVSVISDFHIYYVQMNKKLIPIRSWSDLPGLFGDKKEEVTTFIHDHHLKGRAPEEYAQVVAYYNTLIGLKKITKD